MVCDCFRRLSRGRRGGIGVNSGVNFGVNNVVDSGVNSGVNFGVNSFVNNGVAAHLSSKSSAHSGVASGSQVVTGAGVGGAASRPSPTHSSDTCPSPPRGSQQGQAMLQARGTRQKQRYDEGGECQSLFMHLDDSGRSLRKRFIQLYAHKS